MAKKVELASQVWADPTMRSIDNPRGKLALHYALGKEYDGNQIILEDMALETSLELSECRSWLQSFIAQGHISITLLFDDGFRGI